MSFSNESCIKQCFIDRLIKHPVAFNIRTLKLVCYKCFASFWRLEKLLLGQWSQCKLLIDLPVGFAAVITISIYLLPSITIISVVIITMSLFIGVSSLYRLLNSSATVPNLSMENIITYCADVLILIHFIINFCQPCTHIFMFFCSLIMISFSCCN